ncbi:MAG: prepilin-type N-terminal cleavage/methylation domain-containing protein [Nitrospiraceae bacterium]|nr:MAG: prepilin-type N-terminal cleavage/methylation domain-containing protein [Nitrospiraceae bacterium]
MSNQRGFTLVELAIVMVIIGLLIGAVLKGQAMIDDAKQKRLLNDIQGISAAYFTYYDRYNAIPGDDLSAHGWGTAVGNGSGYINGATEPTAAWQVLRYAGLLSGDPATSGAAAQPRHPFGGTYGFGSAAFGALGTRNYITMVTVPGSVAESIDIKYDDGIYNTGTVRGSAAYTTATVTLQYLL